LHNSKAKKASSFYKDIVKIALKDLKRHNQDLSMYISGKNSVKTYIEAQDSKTNRKNLRKLQLKE
jgi:hypothetical protein